MWETGLGYGAGGPNVTGGSEPSSGRPARCRGAQLHHADRNGETRRGDGEKVSRSKPLPGGSLGGLEEGYGTRYSFGFAVKPGA